MAPLPVEVLEPVPGDETGPRVVCIGGGHGLAQVLQAISGYTGSIAAVVTVADDGGSSGRLAPALDIPPPGDIRRCLLALTPEESHWRSLFEYRFEGADVEGHSLGNLIIAALADTLGGFEEAVAECEWMLATTGSVIPAAPRRLSMEAVIAGGVVKGQSAISHTPGEVTALRLVPDDVTAGARAVAAIVGADQIVVGPGSLYTSVIATLAVPGIADAVNRSPAKLVAVANLITQDAETLEMDAVDHIEALMKLGHIRPPAVLVAEAGPISAPPGLEAVRVEPDMLATFGVDVLLADLVDAEAPWPQHDPARLGRALAKLAN
jgi:uncharacterized cofD-like protein